ncbi:MAG: DUF3500 domain-containing protein [Planctomycetes bacterium]|nr:DUF3500 domain-containing protein [Planctomycetota bacterium]
MTEEKRPRYCPECDESFSRREFLATVGGAALAASSVPLLVVPRKAVAAPGPKSAAETAVKALHETLSESQRKVICFPFDHELRRRINANWKITEPEIGSDFYSSDQRDLIDKIFRHVTSGEGYERFQKQMEEDWGGFDRYTMAIFGEPGTGKFQWEMTGRHMTIRADGDSVENAAFGGPIVYGHGTGDSVAGLPGNVFHYQLKKANEVFAALDGKQREKALVDKAPPENQVPIQGESGKFPGIAIGELSSDQKDLVEKTMKIILAPYREEDVEEAVALLKAGGGLDKLHLAFYKSDNLGDDEEWEIWRLEGPSFVWHFRGSPHVHTYVNIAKKA